MEGVQRTAFCQRTAGPHHGCLCVDDFSLFVSAFDHRHDHFKPTVWLDVMSCMGRDDNRYSRGEEIGIPGDDDFCLSFDDLGEGIEWRYFLRQTLTDIKGHDTDVPR